MVLLKWNAKHFNGCDTIHLIQFSFHCFPRLLCFCQQFTWLVGITWLVLIYIVVLSSLSFISSVNFLILDGFLWWKIYVAGISKPMPLFLRFPVTLTEIFPPCFKNKWNTRDKVKGTCPTIFCVLFSPCSRLTATACVSCGFSGSCYDK